MCQRVMMRCTGIPEGKEWIVLLGDSHGGDLGAIWQRCKQRWASESEGAQTAG